MKKVFNLNVERLSLLFFIVLLLIAPLFISLSSRVVAATSNDVVIAIIDSGVDNEHEFFNKKFWNNPYEISDNQQDDDFNGFIDDVFGWNFSEGNNQIIDRRFFSIFNADHDRFFEIQVRLSTGKATDEDISWFKSKIQDKKFLAECMAYGNFIHGTHVSGISIKNSVNNKIFAVKIIPTEVDVPENNGAHAPVINLMSEDNPMVGDLKDADDLGLEGVDKIKYLLKGLAKRQMEGMGVIATYVDGRHARVANGSFGTGFPQAERIAKELMKEVLQREATPTELVSIINYFFEQIIINGKTVFSKAPNTLFVFAAGNDGTNNDSLPTTPTNIKLSNTISVAATMGTTGLARFSNFGKTMVEVAAPGVAILSTIPGNKFVGLSGTSQATPFVTNVAGEIINLNPNLSPLQVKEILMKTVDVKPFLKDKVVSSGIVNKERAMKAAELSKSKPLDQAISLAVQLIKSSEADKRINLLKEIPSDLEFVLPLRSEFGF